MSNCISSNQNRFYTALESDFGAAAAVTELNRIPAIKLAIKQQVERPQRRDKTGGRTFVGLPNGLRRSTSFDLETYLTGWSDPVKEPGYGPLVRAALGGTPVFFAGAALQDQIDPLRLSFMAPHSLIANQAVAYRGEIRFVTAVVDDLNVQINAPFADHPDVGAVLGPTVTYLPATQLPSVSIHDYWDPQEAVQRVLAGCGVDEMRIQLNGDFHQFRFQGIARELVDSATFTEGQAGMDTFPAEPDLAGWDYALVPGNLGQAWFGNEATQFFTVLDADIRLKNELDTRSQEFGSDLAQCLVPGRRSVTMNFNLFCDTSAEHTALYQAARQQSSIGMMLQMGQDASYLCGVYMKSLVPAIPEFDDGESRLQWKFSSSRAQGTANDELVVAFG